MPSEQELPRFDRRFLGSKESATVIGSGGLGGKASGLLAAAEVLAARVDARRFPGLAIGVPTFAVIGTDVFDAFVARNDLAGLAREGAGDEAIARAFQRADLPAETTGDLFALAREVRAPLAVRSSSLLEDALRHPFAGVYATKMIANDALDPETRFRRLVEAVKFVYASAFFKEARAYVAAAGRNPSEEKMAVVLQEVVGRRHGERFYPDVSGVARSYNFYPVGAGRPEEGVASLALGLGKTIVEGGRCWAYSPARPRVGPPCAPSELLEQTQTGFWAVRMGPPPAYDPINEDEYLVQPGLATAEADEVLARLASTYDASSDRLRPGLRPEGPRVLDFAPLLLHDEPPLSAAVRELLQLFDEATGSRVEIEFAVTFPGGSPARFGLLQVRPMAAPSRWVDVSSEDLADPAALVASPRVMGNGAEVVEDVVYVRPEAFDPAISRAIAAQVEAMNTRLGGRPYLLIGFGRWGSSDPWLGIPVAWPQISGARAIVEAGSPARSVEMSQGAHFFHNLVSFAVAYFSVPDPRGIDFAWLDALPAEHEAPHVRHVRAPVPLTVKVDGRSGRGVVRRGAGND
jgi:hypothetical protein